MATLTAAHSATSPSPPDKPRVRLSLVPETFRNGLLFRWRWRMFFGTNSGRAISSPITTYGGNCKNRQNQNHQQLFHQKSPQILVKFNGPQIGTMLFINISQRIQSIFSRTWAFFLFSRSTCLLALIICI